MEEIFSIACARNQLGENKIEKAKPVYEELDGWNCDISDVTEFDDLPDNAKKYIKRVEELVGIPMSIVSVGPKRSQTIVLKKER